MGIAGMLFRFGTQVFLPLVLALGLISCGGGGGGGGAAPTPPEKSWTSPALKGQEKVLVGDPTLELKWSKAKSSENKDAAIYTVLAGVDTENLLPVENCDRIAALTCSIPLPELALEATYLIRVVAFETEESTEPVASVDRVISVVSEFWTTPIISAPDELISETASSINVTWTKAILRKLDSGDPPVEADPVEAEQYTILVGPDADNLSFVENCKRTSEQTCQIPIPAVEANSKYLIRVEVFETVDSTEPLLIADHTMLLLLEPIVWGELVVTAPEKIEPETQAIDLKWDPLTSSKGSQAAIYTVSAGPDAENLSPVEGCEKTTELTCQVTLPDGLTVGSTYLIRVEAFETETSEAPVRSVDHSLSIEEKVVTWNDPDVTILSSALSGASVELKWTKATTNTGLEAAVYTVKTGTSRANLTPHRDCEQITGLSCTIELPSVTANSTYFVRLEAFDTAGATSPVAFVDRQISVNVITWSRPGLVLPENIGAGGTIKVAWSSSVSAAGEFAAAYTVSSGTDTNSLKPVGGCVKTTESSCSFSAPQVSSETRYYVRLDVFATQESMTPVTFVEEMLTINPLVWYPFSIEAADEVDANAKFDVTWTAASSNTGKRAAVYTVKTGSNTENLKDVLDCIKISEKSCSITAPGGSLAQLLVIRVEAFETADATSSVQSDTHNMQVRSDGSGSGGSLSVSVPFKSAQISFSMTYNKTAKRFTAAPKSVVEVAAEIDNPTDGDFEWKLLRATRKDGSTTDDAADLAKIATLAKKENHSVNLTVLPAATGYAAVTLYLSVTRPGGSGTATGPVTFTFDENPFVAFVSPEGSGAKDASTWANSAAAEDLQDMINAGGVFSRDNDAPVSLYLKEGKYKPSAFYLGTSDRHKTFLLRRGVHLYGGFKGDEATERARREASSKSRDAFFEYETTLTGDLKQDDNNSHNRDENTYHVVTFSDGSGIQSQVAALDGVVIHAGQADSSDDEANKRGAGLYIKAGKTRLKDVIIRDNHALDIGAGLYIGDSASLEFENVNFIGNRASRGGAIFAENATITGKTAEFYANFASSEIAGVYVDNSTVTLGTLVFNSNEDYYAGLSDRGNAIKAANRARLDLSEVTVNGHVGRNGSALQVRSGAIVNLVDSTFSNNFTSVTGGAIYVEGEGSTLNIVGSLLEKNRSYTGGAAFISNGGRLNTIASDFVYNVADIQDGDSFSGNISYFEYGGAIAFHGSRGTLISTRFGNNKADRAGGALRVLDSTIDIISSAIHHNEVRHDFGAAIYMHSYSVVNVVNSAVYSNRSDNKGGGIFIPKDTGSTTLNMIGGSIIDNSSPDHGAGLHIDSADDHMYLTNSVVQGNRRGDSEDNIYGEKYIYLRECFISSADTSFGWGSRSSLTIPTSPLSGAAKGNITISGDRLKTPALYYAKLFGVDLPDYAKTALDLTKLTFYSLTVPSEPTSAGYKTFYIIPDGAAHGTYYAENLGDSSDITALLAVLSPPAIPDEQKSSANLEHIANRYDLLGTDMFSGGNNNSAIGPVKEGIE